MASVTGLSFRRATLPRWRGLGHTALPYGAFGFSPLIPGGPGNANGSRRPAMVIHGLGFVDAGVLRVLLEVQ